MSVGGQANVVRDNLISGLWGLVVWGQRTRVHEQ